MSGLFFVLISLLVSCRPNLPTDEAAGLIFDKKHQDNFTKLTKLTNAEGIRIFWWNVAWGSFNGGGNLDNNLKALVLSRSRPDILILSEHKDVILGQETHQILNKAYPNRDFVTYSPSDIVGVKVYSILPIRREEKRALDWAPPYETEDNKEIYRDYWKANAPSEVKYWDRAYALYSINFNGETYYFSPVHLLEPWKAILDVEGGPMMALRMFAGGDNPLANQVRNLKAMIARDFSGSRKGKPFLLLGDFNVPKSLYVVTPDLYKSLASGYEEIFPGAPDSFPSESSKQQTGKSPLPIDVKIDHVFLNSKLSPVGAAVLHMAGSDHYPIYAVIKPKKSWLW